MSIIGNLVAFLKLDVAEFDRNLSSSVKKLTQAGAAMSNLGRDMTRMVTVPMVAAAASVIKFGSDFEESFAGVRKTVDATESEFAALAQGFRDMAKEIPISVNELNRIGEAAGQLGIEKENILSFTETMAKLGVTTNLSATEAATALARFSNIMGTSQGDFDRLGSVIVDLGNNFATTEAEIVDLGLNIAGAGKQVGLTESQVLAFATALSSVGIQAEKGGTAISRVFTEIEKSVATGSEKLALFAKVLGQSTQEFAANFKKDAAGTLADFITRLGQIQQSGQSVSVVLEALGLDGMRVADTLKRAAGAGDLLTDALEDGSKAWEDNIALSKEAEERFKTFNSQVTILWNKFRDVLITAFERIRPVLVNTIIPAAEDLIEILASMVEAFGKLPEPIQKFTLGLGAIAAFAGPAIYGAGQFTFALKNLLVLGPSIIKFFQNFPGMIATAGTAMFNFGGTILTTVAAFNPFTLALIAITPLIIAYSDEIASAIVTGLEWIGVIESQTEQLERAAADAAVNEEAWNRVANSIGITGEKMREFTKLNKDATNIFADNKSQILEWKAAVEAGTMSQTAFEAELKKLVLTGKKTKEAVSDVKDEVTDTGPPVIDLTGFVGNLDKEFDNLAKSAGDALDPLGSTIERLGKLKGKMDAETIALAFNGELIQAIQDHEKLAEMAKLLGLNIPTLELDEFGETLVSTAAKISLFNREFIPMSEIAKDIAPDLKVATEGVGILGRVVKDTEGNYISWSDATVDAEKKLKDLKKTTAEQLETLTSLSKAGYSNKEITKAMGISATELRDKAKELGVGIDETTKAIIDNIAAEEDWEAAAEQMEDAWTHALGNIFSDFTSSLKGMIFDGEKFSMDLKGIFVELGGSLFEIFVGQITKPLFTAANQLFEKLSQKLVGGFLNLFGLGGGGDGEGGGLDVGLPGFDLKKIGAGLGAGFGKIGGGLAAAGKGIGGAFSGAGSAIGGGIGAIAGLGPALAIPIFGAIGVGAFFGLKKLFGSNKFKAGANEVGRDFGIDVSDGAVKGFVSGIGLSEKAFEDIRKDILSSPKAFQDLLLPVAEATGQVDQLVASFGHLEAFGQVFNLQAEAAQAAAGDFEALNKAWTDIFEQSQELQKQLPNWKNELMGVSTATEETGDAAGDTGDDFQNLADESTKAVADIEAAVNQMAAALIAGFQDVISRLDQLLTAVGDKIANTSNQLADLIAKTEAAQAAAAMSIPDIPGAESPTSAGPGRNIVVNVSSRSEDLVATTRDEVIPILEQELNSGNSSLRATVTRTVNRSSQGITIGG